MLKMKKRACLSLIFLGLLAHLSSCAPSRKEVAEPVLRPSPPRPSKPERLEELVVPLVEERKRPERLLSFSLRDADIRDALLALSKTIEYNVVLDPDVSGKATVEVKRVTLSEALDALLSPLGLQYKKENNIIRVSRRRQLTRVFPLNYITTSRASSGTFSANIALGGGGGSGIGSISSTEASDMWAEIAPGLKGILSEEGKFIINKMAGLIVVTDYPYNLKRVAEFLERVEGSVQRQVMIQAKVVDVNLSDDYKMGLNWSAISRISGLDLKGDLTGGRMFAQALSPGVGIFQMGLSDGDFSMILDAMSKQGKVNILSSPRVSTLNNQKAAIKVVRSEVFFDVSTRVDPDTNEKTTEATSKTVDVGVVLGVIPQIGPDGKVMMNIHPVITEKVGESTFQSADVTLTAPVLTVRETNTVVKIGDGHTMVIAGLIQEKENETKTKVPLLGNIPLLGGLFTKTELAKQKNELVIFLTPTLLTGRRVEEISHEERQRLKLD